MQVNQSQSVCVSNDGNESMSGSLKDEYERKLNEKMKELEHLKNEYANRNHNQNQNNQNQNHNQNNNNNSNNNNQNQLPKNIFSFDSPRPIETNHYGPTRGMGSNVAGGGGSSVTPHQHTPNQNSSQFVCLQDTRFAPYVASAAPSFVPSFSHQMPVSVPVPMVPMQSPHAQLSMTPVSPAAAVTVPTPQANANMTPFGTGIGMGMGIGMALGGNGTNVNNLNNINNVNSTVSTSSRVNVSNNQNNNNNIDSFGLPADFDCDTIEFGGSTDATSIAQDSKSSVISDRASNSGGSTNGNHTNNGNNSNNNNNNSNIGLQSLIDEIVRLRMSNSALQEKNQKWRETCKKLKKGYDHARTRVSQLASENVILKQHLNGPPQPPVQTSVTTSAASAAAAMQPETPPMSPEQSDAQNQGQTSVQVQVQALHAAQPPMLGCPINVIPQFVRPTFQPINGGNQANNVKKKANLFSFGFARSICYDPTQFTEEYDEMEDYQDERYLPLTRAGARQNQTPQMPMTNSSSSSNNSSNNSNDNSNNDSNKNESRSTATGQTNGNFGASFANSDGSQVQVQVQVQAQAQARQQSTSRLNFPDLLSQFIPKNSASNNSSGNSDGNNNSNTINSGGSNNDNNNNKINNDSSGNGNNNDDNSGMVNIANTVDFVGECVQRGGTRKSRKFNENNKFANLSNTIGKSVSTFVTDIGGTMKKGYNTLKQNISTYSDKDIGSSSEDDDIRISNRKQKKLSLRPNNTNNTNNTNNESNAITNKSTSTNTNTNTNIHSGVSSGSETNLLDQKPIIEENGTLTSNSSGNGNGNSNDQIPLPCPVPLFGMKKKWPTFPNFAGNNTNNDNDSNNGNSANHINNINSINSINNINTINNINDVNNIVNISNINCINSNEGMMDGNIRNSKMVDFGDFETHGIVDMGITMATEMSSVGNMTDISLNSNENPSDIHLSSFVGMNAMSHSNLSQNGLMTMANANTGHFVGNGSNTNGNSPTNMFGNSSAFI